MMIEENGSLPPFNTFGIESRADYFARPNSIESLGEVLAKAKQKTGGLLILGGGSNILLTKDFKGTVIKNDLPGKAIIEETNNGVKVKVGAGENWHDFVIWSIEQGLGGIENLSLIPGQVGASPMQNIGAYGVEIENVFVSLNAMNIQSGEIIKFNKNDCRFGYRESVVKNELKDQFVITDVTFELTRKHQYHTSYGVIEAELEKMGVLELSPKAISDAVINIRQSKLPDPAKLGNSGSFFKNPVVSSEKVSNLKKLFPEMPSYEIEHNVCKLAAGWLIEKAGWKGRTVGNCGVHKNQALVLVNYGGATGQEIYKLSEEILTSVYQLFDITL